MHLFDGDEAPASRHEGLQQVLEFIQILATAQHHARRRVVKDTGQAVQMRLAVVLRRECRHRDDIGIQATEKRRCVIRTGRQNEHTSLATTGSQVVLQQPGNRARLRIQLRVAGQQRFLVLVDDVSKGNPVRLALRIKAHQFGKMRGLISYGFHSFTYLFRQGSTHGRPDGLARNVVKRNSVAWTATVMTALAWRADSARQLQRHPLGLRRSARTGLLAIGEDRLDHFLRAHRQYRQQRVAQAVTFLAATLQEDPRLAARTQWQAVVTVDAGALHVVLQTGQQLQLADQIARAPRAHGAAERSDARQVLGMQALCVHLLGRLEPQGQSVFRALRWLWQRTLGIQPSRHVRQARCWCQAPGPNEVRERAWSVAFLEGVPGLFEQRRRGRHGRRCYRMRSSSLFG